MIVSIYFCKTSTAITAATTTYGSSSVTVMRNVSTSSPIATDMIFSHLKWGELMFNVCIF